MYDELVAGRNAVYEALCGSRGVDCVYLQRGARPKGVAKILAACKEKGVPFKEVEREKLDEMAGEVPHQGVAATVAPIAYRSIEEILEIARSRGEAPFVVLCDGILDPHNLGAIIRTAECAGAHGVILPKRRSAPLSAAVYKTSAGACEHLAICRVGNLVQAIESLKKAGLWLYCADMDGQNCRDTDFAGGVGVVVGSEGEGVSKLVKERCDVTVSLPLRGKITSLNASVAAGIVLYEVANQRLAAERGRGKERG
ncbi:23S rRNA (guanosine(2251)-2'-O)-methyltransferase RlmB [Bittarella massiliensis]|uniref:23S rRNA (guanosine(2251)-2'-O)-methyltransferase RlmB n=1 Tax=Bittarella massiliensis (ex Durand et al. 2017) TaxID=1720313 RepID=UPI00163CF9E9|nr:23S rRNA (guanosine(2251)-2'-O)-methyltransferase RlmB [Bittarella massiliensis (ex Durand et al. 2017)]MBC2872009.1 23S rRNA (guanosine(2251)-2'-O)-methyltransferase RlmB [Bittarella massiliensis (ex Durand et al. 2017)]